MSIDEFIIFSKYSSLEIDIGNKISHFENLKISLYEIDDTNFIEFFNLTDDTIDLKNFELIYSDNSGKYNSVDLIKLLNIQKSIPKRNIDSKLNILTYQLQLINLNSKFILKSTSKLENNNIKIDFTKFKSNRNIIKNNNIKKFFDNFSDFILEKDQIIIPSGDYIVNKIIQIPYGYNLTIEKGTNIKFSKNSGIISNNAIYFKGTKNDKIILKPINDSWGGVIIRNAKRKSLIENTLIQK